MAMKGWMVGEANWRGWIARSRTVVGALAFLVAVNGLVLKVSAGKDDRIVAEFVGKSWVNGRSWDHLDYSGKLGFVCGLYDGITLFYSSAEARKTTGKGSLAAIYNSLAAPSSLTVGDVVKGMDEFYQDTANAPLPAICAYLHFVYKSKGDSRESIDEHIAAWRKMFRDK
jgi:hypothetical protein